MARTTLLFNHTHTPDSNRFEEAIRSIDIQSHRADYVAITERLPPGMDAVFVKTDHWQTDPTYFDRLENRLRRHDADLARFESHACFELDGSHACVINGVEASVESVGMHLTIGGLPLDDADRYYNISVDRLGDLAGTAGWLAPAHIGMPFHRIPPEKMDELFETATARDLPFAVGYSTGYFPRYNRLARNEWPFRTSVREHAQEYGVPLLPELDLHGVLPRGFSGCGVLDMTVMASLRDGELPVDGLLDSDLLSPAGCPDGLSVRQFLQNYAVFLPMVPRRADPEAAFEQSIPETDWLAQLDVAASTVPLP